MTDFITHKLKSRWALPAALAILVLIGALAVGGALLLPRVGGAGTTFAV